MNYRIGLACCATLLAACGDPRNEAANELVRLQAEVGAHAEEYGRLPLRLDPALPADSANLPFEPRNGVGVSLHSVTDSQYLGVAQKRSWRCWLVGIRGREGRPDCAPSGGSAPAEERATDSARVPAVLLSPADSGQPSEP